MMEDNYEPSSEFLIWVINGNAPLVGHAFAEANLAKVIEFTTDADTSNRDWAAFIVANLDLDTPLIRASLLACANDKNEIVRAEAIQGLAKRDVALALPFIKRELAAPPTPAGIFEAAATVAHPSLVEELKGFARRNVGDELVYAALAACTTGIPDARYQ